MWLIEEVAYCRIGQFPFGFIQDPRAAENEYTAQGVFLGELNGSGRRRGGCLAEGVTTHSGFEMWRAGKMLIA